MARGGLVTHGWDLAIGEPALFWQIPSSPGMVGVGAPWYPSMSGNPGLVDQLREMYPGHEVVVANGAKQALLAAFYAFETRESKSEVYHDAPYWPSFPTLARLSSMGFNRKVEWGRDRLGLVVKTSPNNPDGAEHLGACDVWDAVYAHDVYGWSGRAPEYRVLVAGAAKYVGRPGARVGWLATREAELAQAAREYVEFTTSGVCDMAQAYVAGLLAQMRRDRSWEVAVKDGIARNGDLFFEHLGKECEAVEGSPGGGAGMFAFFAPVDARRFAAALVASQVRLVDGAACGRPGWYRMNMCHQNQYTERALKALRGAYDQQA